MIDFKKLVDDKIAASNPIVADRVVEQLAEKELRAREKALAAILVKRNEQELVIQNTKPSSLNYSTEGVPSAPVFTAEQWKTKKKAAESISKIDAAIQRAFEANDWSGVMRLAKGEENTNGNVGKSEGPRAEAPGASVPDA